METKEYLAMLSLYNHGTEEWDYIPEKKKQAFFAEQRRRQAEDWLTNKEFEVLLELFHQFNAAFNYLPDYIRNAYQVRLMSRR